MTLGQIGVVAAGVLGYWALAAGQSSSFAVMKTPTRDAIEISELSMSAYFSAAQLCASVLVPFAGLGVDKLGIRATFLASVTSMSAACLAMASAVDGPSVCFGLFAIRLSCKCEGLPNRVAPNQGKHRVVVPVAREGTAAEVTSGSCRQAWLTEPIGLANRSEGMGWPGSFDQREGFR